MADNRQTTGLLDERLLEENLEDLYEHAPCGYVSTLPDGIFAKVNQTFLTWTGYTRDELLAGKRFQDLLTAPGKIFHETHFAPLLHMQGVVNEVAFDLVCRDGRRLPVLLNAAQKQDASGAPLLHRITIFNARDRREYERELLLARRKAEEATQAKARFLSTVSHEIRTPLSAISLASELLERASADPRQQRYIRNLKSASASLLALVNDILDYSKIEAGAVALEERKFDVREFMADILARQEAAAEAKQIVVQMEIDEDVPAFLVGDPLKIGQVVTNLMSNAVKFTEKGSVKLTLRVREASPETMALDFSVQDTGIGIAPEQQEHIFEEFRQASSSISGTYGGTGLGLAISQKLVQLYSSEIKVQSTPGQGSTFFFTLRLKT